MRVVRAAPSPLISLIDFGGGVYLDTNHIQAQLVVLGFFSYIESVPDTNGDYEIISEKDWQRWMGMPAVTEHGIRDLEALNWNPPRSPDGYISLFQWSDPVGLPYEGASVSSELAAMFVKPKNAHAKALLDAHLQFVEASK